MGVVDEAVEDGVGVGGVADEPVPVGDGDLAGDERRSSAVAVLEDFEEVVAGLRGQGFETPVVEDQEVDGAEAFETAGEAAVAVGQDEFVEQLGRADVEDRLVVAAGFVAERAGQPTLAEPGRYSVTMPGVRCSRCGSTIRSIRGPDNLCMSSTLSDSRARIIWPCANRMVRLLCFRPG